MIYLFLILIFFIVIFLTACNVNTKEIRINELEEIQIKKDFFRGIRFESRNNSKGYNWIGYGKILDKRYIVGEWYSLNSAAYASGVFIYTIAARGDYMTGYEAVPDENGKIYYREFCLGRKEEDLINAKKWLKEHKE